MSGRTDDAIRADLVDWATGEYTFIRPLSERLIGAAETLFARALAAEAEVERLTAINAEQCDSHNALLIWGSRTETERDESRAREARLAAQIAEAMTLHTGGMPLGGEATCRACRQPWPCPTVAALASTGEPPGDAIETTQRPEETRQAQSVDCWPGFDR